MLVQFGIGDARRPVQTAEKQIGGEPASFAVDYLRIIPQGTTAPAEFDAPYLAGLRQRFKVGAK